MCVHRPAGVSGCQARAPEHSHIISDLLAWLRAAFTGQLKQLKSQRFSPPDEQRSGPSHIPDCGYLRFPRSAWPRAPPPTQAPSIQIITSISAFVKVNTLVESQNEKEQMMKNIDSFTN